jgi:hypothetical protein
MRSQIAFLLMFLFLQGISGQSLSPQARPDKNEVIFYQNVTFHVLEEPGIFQLQVSSDPTFKVGTISHIISGTSFTIPELEVNKNYFWRVYYLDKWHGIYPFFTSNIKITLTTSIDDIRLLPTVMMDKQWIIIDNPNHQQLDIHVHDDRQNLILHQVSDSAIKNIEIQEWLASAYTIKIASSSQSLNAQITIADVK